MTVRRPSMAIVLIGLLLAFAALARGQGLKSFDFATGKAEFYSPAASHSLSQKAIKGGQPAIHDRVRGLQGQAAQAQASNPTTASVNLSGTWTAQTGLRYVIQQYGSEAVIQESSPYGVTAAGSGTVQGDAFTFRFQAINGSTGTGQLSLANSNTLTGTFTGDAGVVEPQVLQR